MASVLALVAAFFFALAAALQQKGALNLPEISLRNPASLARLVGQKMWLLGTAALLTGYVLQAAALDRGASRSSSRCSSPRSSSRCRSATS
jgi:hypothetical protein